MEKIAVIYGQYTIYWSSVLLVLAGAVSVCLYLALYLCKGGNIRAAAVSVPLTASASLFAARFLHWYCRTDSYDSLSRAMTEFSSGGYALAGVFAGCVAVAALLRLVRLSKNLPEMLDCMAVAGSAGIAVGRLSFFFNNADRGMVLETLRQLPLASGVTNPVSGEAEYRLAVFFLQALAAGGIFACLLIFWLWGTKKQCLPDGDTALVFLLCYGASQVLLDSARYDSLYLRSNGFVSLVQVLGAVGIVLAAVVFSCRLIRQRGWKNWDMLLWIGFAALFGLGGYMEYYVQRRAYKALLAYSIMGSCLAGLIVLVLIIRKLAEAARLRKLVRQGWEEN